MIQQTRYLQAKQVTLIGAFVNMFLGVLKLIAGFFFHSHALVADGVHSFSDLLTDALVLFASKFGSLDADDSHPYGHQRIETAATLLLSLFLIIIGLSIAWDALSALMNSTAFMPHWLSIPVVLLSIGANEILFHYTRLVGQRISSPLIIANAWHHRSDAASSIVVLIGLIGSLAGFTYLDTLSAILVGLMISKMGCDYGWNSVKELVDTAVSPDLLAQITEIICKVDGVLKVHQLRSRSMGSNILIDVRILVASKISVSEGHYIAHQVYTALAKQIPNVTDTIVHIDPEDDKSSGSSLHLPSRKTLHAQLFKEIKACYPAILYWNIHYLDGKIIIEIVCSENFSQTKELCNSIKLILKTHTYITEVRILTRLEIIS